jgi:DMSO/TMAO reductase YedYZ molybdopterin-dependent catalytic subunit
MTRRKFVKMAGSALALANIPLAARALYAENEPPPSSFGGPTPNDKFYLTSFGSTPKVDATKWSLKIHGLVREPITLSYEAIKAMPQVHETLTLECISNPPDGWAISNADWVGVKLKPLLERARVKTSAVYAAMRGADGYYAGVPVDEILREENFMPYLMNGVALPPDHGYPLRVFIPGKYGMKQPKWLTEIEFVDHEFTGYWEARGWSNEAWRKVNSGFFYPRPSSNLLNILALNRAAQAEAPVDIVGWALAGPSGIKRVQVSVDDGKTWHDAELLKNVPYVWTVWKYHFAPRRAMTYAIRVKATAGDGSEQPELDPQTGAGMSAQARMDLKITGI